MPNTSAQAIPRSRMTDPSRFEVARSDKGQGLKPSAFTEVMDQSVSAPAVGNEASGSKALLPVAQQSEMPTPMLPGAPATVPVSPAAEGQPATAPVLSKVVTDPDLTHDNEAEISELRELALPQVQPEMPAPVPALPIPMPPSAVPSAALPSVGVGGETSANPGAGIGVEGVESAESKPQSNPLSPLQNPDQAAPPQFDAAAPARASGASRQHSSLSATGQAVGTSTDAPGAAPFPELGPVAGSAPAAVDPALLAAPSQAALLPTQVPHATVPAPAPSAPTTPAQQIAPVVAAVLAAPDDGTPQPLIIRLNPAELGRIQVRIDRTADGPSRISLSVERPDTLLMLVRDQPQLHRALDLAGIPPDGRTVQFQLAPDPAPMLRDATGFGMANPDSGSGQPAQGRPGGRNSNGNYPGHEQVSEAAQASNRRMQRAGIDITA